MICPFCKEDLVQDADQSYVTIVEHVCDPNAVQKCRRPTWVCSNKMCCTKALHLAPFWDKDGEFYGADIHDGTGFNSALNSFARKIDVEIRKKDENRTSFIWRGFSMHKIYTYTANDMGHVVSRKHHYRFDMAGFWGSSGSNPISAIYNTIRDKIFRFGSGYWKTPEQRKQGIKHNLNRLCNDLKNSLEK